MRAAHSDSSWAEWKAVMSAVCWAGLRVAQKAAKTVVWMAVAKVLNSVDSTADNLVVTTAAPRVVRSVVYWVDTKGNPLAGNSADKWDAQRVDLRAEHLAALKVAH